MSQGLNLRASYNQLLVGSVVLCTSLLGCDPPTPMAVPLASSVGDYSAWKSRRLLNVVPSDTELTDYQAKLELSGAEFDFANARPDGSDVRFALFDGQTQLNSWIERWTPDSATLWVRVPSIAVGGTTVWMYYGSHSAPDVSSGDSTFDFFDDFSGDDHNEGYFELSDKETVLTQSPAPSWENTAPHTMTVVEAGSGEYQYWGYYGLQACEGFIGIARSNDLSVWNKDSNPLPFSQKGDRWPSVVVDDGTYYMAHEKAYCGASYIVLRSSTDGINFSAPTTLVAREQTSDQDYVLNQNPALFKDPASGDYYLYWMRAHMINRSILRWEIRTKSASTLADLANASSVLLMSYPTVYAAPQVMYKDGTYFMAVEALESSVWSTRILTSDAPDGTFREIADNPIVGNGSACFFQHIFGDTLHAFSCEYDKSTATWTLGHRTADLRAGRMQISAPSSDLWAPTGGNFTIVQGTQPDGSIGPVMEGRTTQSQLILSSYVGTDYTVEAYGNLVKGRVWGLGLRASDSANLVSVNIYEDLDATNNLFVYQWEDGTATEVAKAAVGAVDLGAWHKLTATIGGTRLIVKFDEREILRTDVVGINPGQPAVYGERGSVMQIDDFRVRSYADPEPVVQMGPEQILY